ARVGHAEAQERRELSAEVVDPAADLAGALRAALPDRLIEAVSGEGHLSAEVAEADAEAQAALTHDVGHPRVDGDPVGLDVVDGAAQPLRREPGRDTVGELAGEGEAEHDRRSGERR